MAKTEIDKAFLTPTDWKDLSPEIDKLNLEGVTKVSLLKGCYVKNGIIRGGLYEMASTSDPNSIIDNVLNLEAGVSVYELKEYPGITEKLASPEVQERIKNGLIDNKTTFDFSLLENKYELFQQLAKNKKVSSSYFLGIDPFHSSINLHQYTKPDTIFPEFCIVVKTSNLLANLIFKEECRKKKMGWKELLESRHFAALKNHSMLNRNALALRFLRLLGFSPEKTHSTPVSHELLDEKIVVEWIKPSYEVNYNCFDEFKYSFNDFKYRFFSNCYSLVTKKTYLLALGYQNGFKKYFARSEAIYAPISVPRIMKRKIVDLDKYQLPEWVIFRHGGHYEYHYKLLTDHYDPGASNKLEWENYMESLGINTKSTMLYLPRYIYASQSDPSKMEIQELVYLTKSESQQEAEAKKRRVFIPWSHPKSTEIYVKWVINKRTNPNDTTITSVLEEQKYYAVVKDVDLLSF